MGWLDFGLVDAPAQCFGASLTLTIALHQVGVGRMDNAGFVLLKAQFPINHRLTTI